MNTSMTPRDIKLAVYTVSTSLLLCSTLEVQAASTENDPIPWERGSFPVVSLMPSALGISPHNLATNPSPQAESQWLARNALLDPAPISPALYTSHSSNGDTQRVGIFVDQNQFFGGSAGFASPPGNNTLALQGQSLGAYWSLTSAQGWHVNLVAANTHLNGFARTGQSAWQATEGSAVTLSVEGGYSIGISDNWVIEPQAQVINQRTSLGSTSNATNAPSTDTSTWSGRVGARLQGNYQVNGLPVEPYVRTNLWQTYSSGELLSLGPVDKINSSRNASSVEVGLGLLARVTPNVSLFVSGDYSGSTDGAFGLIGNLGVRVRW
ncbi:autotransporter outer membrane beta-barrel domain-containing protein [Pseudomonas sp. NA-150]|uniref:autotransporter outer membrane beta-barrel domain-containing protein n=1 Tax=Pseudomonas sp. NA-150 TaxID=3367525 RepID=UPI0037CA01ED